MTVRKLGCDLGQGTPAIEKREQFAVQPAVQECIERLGNQ